MNNLFEESCSLNIPAECFDYSAESDNFPIKPHWHYFAELILIREGNAKMLAGDDTYILNEGDFIIFHPSEVHSILPSGNILPKYSVIKFDVGKLTLTPAYAPKIRDILRLARNSGMKICFKKEEAQKLDCDRFFSECIREINECKYGRDLVIQSEIYRLLMNVIRLWINEGFVIDDVPKEEVCSIENITEYIDLYLCDNIQVSEIAKHCNMSYSCFAKKFRSFYGISCKQYIEKMRIYKAEEFLLFTDYDLSYISQETGFSDCSHLIKCFKKHRGVTPKQFRAGRTKYRSSVYRTS